MAELQPVARYSPGSDAYLREQLLARRSRLTAPGLANREGVRSLLRDVDSALERLERGSYGLCQACHEPVEPERLITEPLTRVCLGCLTPRQALALERDLELASAIQAALLPPAAIAVDGWEIHHRYHPLGPVSGDHCDVVRPAGARESLHFVLGDVSGKGVAASILMSHLHAIFRSLVPLGLPLHELVRHANRLFAECTLPSSYATVVAGRLDPSGSLELCNAGHCPPLLARNGSVTPLGSTGLPLGLFSTSEFEVKRVELNPGELLLLYTDGLSEAANGGGEQYGAERIGHVLNTRNGGGSPAVLDALMADLSGFSGATPREDDLTLMAIRRTG